MHNDPAESIEILFWQTPSVEAHETVAHTEHVLSYMVSGSLKMDHGQPLESGPGMFTVLPSGVPHRSLGGGEVGLWLIRFCATCHQLDEMHPIMEVFRRVRLGALPVFCQPRERQAHLAGLLEAFHSEAGKDTPESPDVLRSYLFLVLAEANRAMRSVAPQSNPATGSLVGDALAYIQANCLNPISPKDVAAAVHRTPAHTTAMLKKATGFSAGQWITSGRVSEAARRLTHTDDSMEMIAEHVGWKDVTHFIRQFRKAYGKTPAAWRMAGRDGDG